jgi:signal transduction histidine kinase
VAVPESAPPETAALVQALLALCAEHLALRLELEDLERQRRALVEELAGQARLADFGELAGPVAHELNNFLNLVLLHVAVLEPEVPPGLRHELAEIRRQGASAGALVKQLQQSPRRPPVWQPVDLNRVVRQVVAAGRLAPGGAAVQLALAPVLPPVLGSVTDVERLVTFLLTNAAAAAAGGSVHLRTEAAADKVVLRVEDTGPAVAAETLHRLFEPGHAGREGTSSLELAACERLARRLRGRIWGESRAEGGLVVTVELPAHAP